MLHKTFFIWGLVIYSTTAFSQAVTPTSNMPVSTSSGGSSLYPGMNNFGTISNVNFVREYIPQIPTTNANDVSLSGINNNGPAFQTKVKTSYVDGLGRPLQEVQRCVVTTGIEKRDLVSTHVYDVNGREAYKYLPYSVKPYYTQRGKIAPGPIFDIPDSYNDNPGEQYYSKTEFDNSPLNKITKELGAGNSWVGSGRGITYTYSGNLNGNGDAIFNFSIGNTGINYSSNSFNDLPVNNGRYDAGHLDVLKTTDEDGKWKQEFKDEEGRLVATLRYFDYTGIAPQYFYRVYNITYNVYDDLGHLRFVITPEAYNRMMTVGSLTTTIADSLCYQYYYDDRNRMIAKKLPGKSIEYIVYDNKDRVVLVQDGNLRDQQKWTFTVYDKLDRPVISGVTVPIYGNMGPQDWSNFFNTANISNYTNNTLGYFLLKTDLYHEYENGFLYDADVYVKNYYDDYNYNELLDFSYDPSPESDLTGTAPLAAIAAPTNNTRGLLTGNKTLILDGTNSRWTSVANYYDDKGQLIQQQKKNHRGGISSNTYQYDFVGTLVSSVNLQPDLYPVPGTNPPLTQMTKVVKKYTKDYSTGEITTLDQNINATEWRRIFTNKYNKTGLLGQKYEAILNNIYSYNVRGWLTGINSDFVNKAAVTQMPDDILFAEKISYDKGFASQLYDGDIAGIQWRMSGVNTTTQAYGYTYDNLNRLAHAQYSELMNTGTWYYGISNNDFTASNITYDNNGNMRTMNQRTPGNPYAADMDVLTYKYYGNLLMGVKDDAPSGTTTWDFKDDPNHSLSDYTYDNNGNLKTDLNKKINTPITYNYQNKPVHIAVDGKGTIDNLYDAVGNKLNETVYDANANITTSTDYLDNFVYENDQLKYISHEEGRCRPGNSTQPFLYDYYLKDHLNNIRSVVNAEMHYGSNYYVEQMRDFGADLEISSANIEAAVWDHLDEVRTDKPGSTDPWDTKAAGLLGTDPDKRIGPATMLRVMPGDQFSLSALSYQDAVGNPADNDPGQLANSILTTFAGGTVGGTTQVAELPEKMRIINGAFGNADFAALYSQLLDNNYDPTAPALYLNCLFFDENFRLIPDQSVVIQAGGVSGQWNTMETNSNIIVGQPGYMAVFASSRMASLGYMDKFNLVYYKGQTLEENHYYPFGLTVTSSTTNPSEQNKFKFASKELQSELGLNWYNYGARQFDMQTGRWLSQDPLAEKNAQLSQYTYSGNNPVILTDKDGNENMVYLINLNNSGLTSAQVSAMATQSTAALHEMGINVEVKPFSGNPADFKSYNLDRSDAVVAIGQKADVVSFVKNLNGDLGNAMDGKLGGNSPENSQQGGYIVGLDTKTLENKAHEFNSDIVTAGSMFMLHGLGHNADSKTDHNETSGFALRWSGEHVGSAITGNSYLAADNSVVSYGKKPEFNSLGDFLNNKPYNNFGETTPRNQGYINLMKNRFNGTTSKDNYNNNQKKWDEVKKYFHWEPPQGFRVPDGF